MTEKQLQSSIIEFLNYSGKCWVWNVNSGMIKAEYKGKTRLIAMAQKGHPDIAGIRRKDGKFIGIEVKLPERIKSVTEYQEMYLQQIKDYGGIAGVATSPEEALSIVLKEVRKET